MLFDALSCTDSLAYVDSFGFNIHQPQASSTGQVFALQPHAVCASQKAMAGLLPWAAGHSI